MDFGFEHEQGVDRLSGLPDHIICYILSYLPTKHVVASSILSTRWRYLWTFVPNLDFDARLHGGFSPQLNINTERGSELSFQHFVNRVMLFNDISHIRKFRLIYECHHRVESILTWFRVAITQNIQELELDMFFSVEDELVKLPKKLFTSKTLVVLKLSRMCFDVPSFVCFPSLKILELKRITYLDDKCMQNVLSGCQVLEVLVIEETAREKPRVVDISSHTLKSFSFSYKFVIDITVDCPYKFLINAPNLEYLHVKGRISDDFVIKSLLDLAIAHLDLRRTAVLPGDYNLCRERVCNLFRGIANTKSLTLSNDVVQLLCAGLDDQCLPRFPNLTNLAFGIWLDFCWKRLLIEFIKRSPDLEALTLNNKQGFLRDVDELRKTPARPVPDYLLLFLKHILIKELYTNFTPETVENLVKDVDVLKRLKVNCQCPNMLRFQTGHAS